MNEQKHEGKRKETKKERKKKLIRSEAKWSAYPHRELTSILSGGCMTTSQLTTTNILGKAEGITIFKCKQHPHPAGLPALCHPPAVQPRTQ